MTKTDFAELKEELTKIDYVDANAYLTRYMEGGYVEPTYQQYGDYIHGKSAAIISELIEIIKLQSEALELSTNLLHNAYYEIDDDTDEYKEICIKNRECIIQTTTRLQKLRDGK